MPVRNDTSPGAGRHRPPGGLAPWIIAALLLAPGCRPPAAPAAPRNVILISIDTLRADHLGTYGYHRPISPNIDRMAAEGIVFESAVSNAPWTSPAHASMLTGFYPASHGLTHTGRRISPRARTLAEALRQAGFATGGFTGGITIASWYGFARGFDVYDEGSGVYLEGILPRALEWIDAQGSRPFFLFLHSFDPHYPYRRHPEIVATFPDAAPPAAPPYTPRDLDSLAETLNAGRKPSGSEMRALLSVVLFPKEMKSLREKIEPSIFRVLGKIRAGEPLDGVDTAVAIAGRPYKPEQVVRFSAAMGETVTEEEFYRAVAGIVPLLAADSRYREDWMRRLSEAQRDAYDANIAVADRSIGLLLAHLARAGRLDDTLIVFTSDHGESFLDHLPADHETVLYEELLHVPLIVRPPGGLAASRRIAPVVELTDLFPSILEILGVAPGEPVQGRSLAAVWRGADLPPASPAWLARAEPAEAVGAGPAAPGGPGEAAPGAPGDPLAAGSAQGLAFSEYMNLTASLRSDRWKLMRVLPSGRDELYDLKADPREAHNLVSEDPGIAAALRGALLEQRRRNASIAARLGIAEAEPDEEMKEKLRSLGYVH